MFPAVPILFERSAAFDDKLGQLMRRGGDDLEAVAPVVREIVADVRRSGEEAVRRYVDAFERRTPARLVMTGNTGPFSDLVPMGSGRVVAARRRRRRRSTLRVHTIHPEVRRPRLSWSSGSLVRRGR